MCTPSRVTSLAQVIASRRIRSGCTKQCQASRCHVHSLPGTVSRSIQYTILILCTVQPPSSHRNITCHVCSFSSILKVNVFTSNTVMDVPSEIKEVETILLEEASDSSSGQSISLLTRNSVLSSIHTDSRRVGYRFRLE